MVVLKLKRAVNVDEVLEIQNFDNHLKQILLPEWKDKTPLPQPILLDFQNQLQKDSSTVDT